MSSIQKPKILWAFLFLFSYSTSFAGSRFTEQHIKPVQERAFDSQSQSLLLAGAMATLFARGEDSRMQEYWKDNRTMPESVADWGDRFDKYAIGPLIALGQLAWDRENGISHARALTYNALVTWTLKGAINRQRPDQSNYLSFPSGHSSSAFATATSLSYAYGYQVGMFVYPAATFVALSRMADNVHWFSDVVAGAFIGVWMGRASFYSREIDPHVSRRNDWTWTPIFNSQTQGIQLQRDF